MTAPNPMRPSPNGNHTHVVSGLLDPHVPPWMDRARCLDADPDAFFPEKGGSVTEAIAICRECPVRDDCLEYALDNDERWGVWGGHTERQRRRIRLQREAR